MTEQFTERVVVVTGAASGIGASSARLFAERGAAVVVTDIDGDGAQRVAAEIRDAGGEAVGQTCDVARAVDWEDVAALAMERHGRVDVVHNNAFVLINEPAHKQTEEGWARQIDVNLASVYRSVKTFLPELKRARGCIVNTASVHAMLGFPGHPAYAAAKGGMVALTRQLAVEYGPDVRVNAVLPGPILTPNWRTVDDAYRESTMRVTPAGRMGRPEEVAAAVCFLASSDASFVSGAALLVDGGFTAQKDPS